MRARTERQWSVGRGWLAPSRPTLRALFPLLLVVCIVVFMRWPASNYVFDEQEALLANPYLNDGALPLWEAFRRDFWGLTTDGSIGSYRPLPNLVWKALGHISDLPWFLQLPNLVLHALNAALLGSFTWALSRSSVAAYLAAVGFAVCAMTTEAVAGVVGLADLLAGAGVLVALHSLVLPCRYRWLLMALGTFVGLLAKESAMVAVPLVAAAACALESGSGARASSPAARMGLGLLSTLAAFVGYTYFRRALFPVASVVEYAAAPDAGPLAVAYHALIDWFQQPALPRDPINNPLVVADTAERAMTALSVYARCLFQVTVPWRLSGDYSYPEESIVSDPWSPAVVGGGLLLTVPIALGVFGLARLARRPRLPAAASRESRPRLLAAASLALLWAPLAYFPHSNLPVLLPTIRAERLFYIPAMGWALALGVVGALVLRHGRTASPASLLGVVQSVSVRSPGMLAVAAAFFAFQALQARVHALAYSNDLWFWRATVVAAPQSAKANLNYGVMLGARGERLERAIWTRRCVELAPTWAMGQVYYGDALHGLGRDEQAWLYYRKGFELAPNQKGIIALGLQAVWDSKQVERRREELAELARRHPNTWLALMIHELLTRGEEFDGIRPAYRPRSYDQRAPAGS